MMISVVINTYSRANCLKETVAAFQKQSLPPEQYEIVIVDDGSTDETCDLLPKLATSGPAVVKYRQQSNCGPAAARNAGLGLAGGTLIVFVGDDIVPSRHFLQTHLSAHEKNGHQTNVAVAGFTQWHANIKVTPFLDYIAKHGPQFAYSRAPQAGWVGRSLFYSSNVSLRRELLGRVNPVFDADFRYAAYEDIDLAYRLEKLGMRVYFEPQAVASHNHPMDVRSFAKRQELVGRSYHFLDRKYGPEATKVAARPRFTGLLKHFEFPRKAMEWLLQLIDGQSIPLPFTLYGVFLALCFAKGYESSAKHG